MNRAFSLFFRRVSELSDFVRLRIAIYLVCLAISGYLLFNPSGGKMAYVILGAFFTSCGAYGYNTVTDKEEDAINGRESRIAASRAGLAIVFFCFALGAAFSYFLGAQYVLLSAAAVLTSVAYSYFRLKKYFIVKNIYTGLTVPISFVFGAAEFSAVVLEYYLSLSLFFFMGSVVSDIRDYGGDRRAGVRTIPVRLGIGAAKKAVHFLAALLLILFLGLDARALLPLIIALPAVCAFVAKDKPHLAHLSIGSSLPLFAAWLAAYGVLI